MEQSSLPYQQRIVNQSGGIVHIHNNPFSEIEPFTEPVTIKLGEKSKEQLAALCQKYGYTSLSVFLRDMIKIGVRAYPHLNKTLSDILP